MKNLELKLGFEKFGVKMSLNPKGHTKKWNFEKAFQIESCMHIFLNRNNYSVISKQLDFSAFFKRSKVVYLPIKMDKPLWVI